MAHARERREGRRVQGGKTAREKERLVRARCEGPRRHARGRGSVQGGSKGLRQPGRWRGGECLSCAFWRSLLPLMRPELWSDGPRRCGQGREGIRGGSKRSRWYGRWRDGVRRGSEGSRRHG